MGRRVSDHRLAHSTKAPAAARDAVRADLADILSGDRLHDATVIASELSSNAVKHAPPMPDGGVELRIEIDPHEAWIVVIDGGRDFDPAWAEEATVRTSQMGLWLVDQLADSWGVSDDGVNGVWAEIRLGERRGLEG
jgi:anti-sigma regulatory factor (Ser/Thr protein kinase)